MEGGGGYSGYILVGVCPRGCALAHQKKGGGVLGAGTAQKKGGLRCGHNHRYVYNPKKGEFRTDFVKRVC